MSAPLAAVASKRAIIDALQRAINQIEAEIDALQAEIAQIEPAPAPTPELSMTYADGAL